MAKYCQVVQDADRLYNSYGVDVIVNIFSFLFQDRFHNWLASFNTKLLHNNSFKFTRRFGFFNDFTLIQQTCKKDIRQTFSFGNDQKHYRFTLVHDLCEEHRFTICKCNDNYFNPNVNEEPFRLFVYNKLKGEMQVQKIWFLERDNMFVI